MKRRELPYYSEMNNHELQYHHEGDAGLDLPIWDERLENGELGFLGYINLPPGGSITLKTGVHLAIPKENVGLLDSRSGTSKKKLDLLCRVIDEPFRGNISLAIINLGDKDVQICNGDELFQIVILPYTKVGPTKFNSYKEFLEYSGETSRGSDGFGSKEKKRRDKSE